MTDLRLEGRKLSLSHLGVCCFDLPRMVAFYTGVLGMTQSDRGELPAPFDAELVFLTTDPGEHHHLIPINHGNAWSLYTRDPEGNALEFVVDTPWFVHQPCGEGLDLTLDDAEILRQTEKLCETRGGEPYADWRTRIARQIVSDQAALR